MPERFTGEHIEDLDEVEDYEKEIDESNGELTVPEEEETSNKKEDKNDTGDDEEVNKEKRELMREYGLVDELKDVDEDSFGAKDDRAYSGLDEY